MSNSPVVGEPAERFSGDPKRTSLADAKSWLRQRVNAGAECPCCTQFAKVYPRIITSSMAYVLILIERWSRTRPEGEWLHVQGYIAGLKLPPRIKAALRGDFAKLRFWNLLEEQQDVREDGSNRVGYFRITSLGRDFVHGRCEVPRHVHIFSGRVLARPVIEKIDIRQALGKRFNYSEIMTTIVEDEAIP